MLSEKVCIHCKRKVIGQKNQMLFRHLSSGFAWYCPELKKIVSCDANPPDGCPYFLEHVVSVKK